jgi:3D (Asp-Asp-Asp) domain-containing protein
VPFGSRIRLEGLKSRYNGTYVVADSGRAIKGTDVDIFISDCSEAKRFGRQRTRVHVIRPAAPAQRTDPN